MNYSVVVLEAGTPLGTWHVRKEILVSDKELAILVAKELDASSPPHMEIGVRDANNLIWSSTGEHLKKETAKKEKKSSPAKKS
jgi:DNA topoisomerase VI subunit A